ncbi:hypothetical protein ACWC10_04235 [Streptomyces sp. NPDC001595]|uniref:hypothetical protein n=1 Tax=Streptomyces sp. NPDC001532 TaxID=3154520 RepID=UPI003333C3E3
MQRKGAGARGGGDLDVEAVLDELYTTPPPGFVARREELAAAARTAGNAEDARRIRAARRPAPAAWAANLLLRAEPEESSRLLEMGEALREAYRTLDPVSLKDLSARRRQVVAALSREAARLAAEAGHSLSAAARQNVASTLHAVLADPDAAEQWATGRLTGTLTPPSDFQAADPAAVGARSRPTRSAPPKAPPSATPSGTPATAGARPAKSAPGGTSRKDELAERRRVREEQLARARETAEAAERRLTDRRAELTAAAEPTERARERRDEAREQADAAEQRLRAAREALETADVAHHEAERRRHEAADAVTRAEKEAHTAAQDVRRLEPRTRRR